MTTEVTRGLTGWIKFLEGTGTNILDVKQGLSSTATGSPLWVGGKINTYAMDFDGTDDYVTVNATLKVGQIFSYSFWFKRDVDGGWYPIFMGSEYIAGVASSGGASVFQNQATNCVRFEILSNNISRQSITSAVGSYGDLTGNFLWNHCAAVSDGRYISLYLNGRLLGRALKTVTLNWNSATFVLAKKCPENPGGTATYFNGQIDDVRVYNRPLDESEIRALALMMPYRVPRWVDVAASGSQIKTVDGLAIASVKTIDGLAIGSVKTRSGLSNV